MIEGSRSTRTPLRVLWLTALVLACGAVLVRSVRQAAAAGPLCNWDMVSYAALALEWEEDDAAVVHRRTYETLEAELPPGVFHALVGNDLLRRRATDGAAFAEFLDFQRVRVLYTLPVWALHRAGVELSAATWWISRAAWVALALLGCWWASRSLGWSLGLVVGTLLALAPWLVTQMSRSTPDLQASFFGAFGVLCLFELGRPRLGASLLSATLLMRPDSVLLVLCLGAAIWAGGVASLPSRRFVGVWVGLSCLGNWIAGKLAGGLSWWTVFYTGFHRHEVFPSTIGDTPDPALYLEVLARKLQQLPYPGYFVSAGVNWVGVRESTLPFVLAALLLAGLAVTRRLGNVEPFGRQRVLLWALLSSSAVHWVLWPRLGDRFFTIAYVCTPFVFLTIVTELVRAREVASAEPGSE